MEFIVGYFIVGIAFVAFDYAFNEPSRRVFNQHPIMFGIQAVRWPISLFRRIQNRIFPTTTPTLGLDSNDSSFYRRWVAKREPQLQRQIEADDQMMFVVVVTLIAKFETAKWKLPVISRESPHQLGDDAALFEIGCYLITDLSKWMSREYPAYRERFINYVHKQFVELSADALDLPNDEADRLFNMRMTFYTDMHHNSKTAGDVLERLTDFVIYAIEYGKCMKGPDAPLSLSLERVEVLSKVILWETHFVKTGVEVLSRYLTTTHRPRQPREPARAPSSPPAPSPGFQPITPDDKEQFAAFMARAVVAVNESDQMASRLLNFVLTRGLYPKGGVLSFVLDPQIHSGLAAHALVVIGLAEAKAEPEQMVWETYRTTLAHRLAEKRAAGMKRAAEASSSEDMQKLAKTDMKPEFLALVKGEMEIWETVARQALSQEEDVKYGSFLHRVTATFGGRKDPSDDDKFVPLLCDLLDYAKDKVVPVLAKSAAPDKPPEPTRERGSGGALGITRGISVQRITGNQCGDLLSVWLQKSCSPGAAEQVAKEAGYNNSPLFGAKKKKIKLMGELVMVNTALAIFAVNQVFNSRDTKSIIDPFLSISRKSVFSVLEKNDNDFKRKYENRMTEYFGILAEGKSALGLSFSFMKNLELDPLRNMQGQILIAARFGDSLSKTIDVLRSMTLRSET